jgi:hypothetical protein
MRNNNNINSNNLPVKSSFSDATTERDFRELYEKNHSKT